MYVIPDSGWVIDWQSIWSAQNSKGAIFANLLLLARRFSKGRQDQESSGFFSPQEIEVARELVQERLAKGVSSGYFFLFAEAEGRVVGYACYGPIPAPFKALIFTGLPWNSPCAGAGLGRELLQRSEQAIALAGGSRIYVETSSRELYGSTRGFYEACGYGKAAVLEDFYAPGDDKVIYLKVL